MPPHTPKKKRPFWVLHMFCILLGCSSGGCPWLFAACVRSAAACFAPPGLRYSAAPGLRDVPGSCWGSHLPDGGLKNKKGVHDLSFYIKRRLAEEIHIKLIGKGSVNRCIWIWIWMIFVCSPCGLPDALPDALLDSICYATNITMTLDAGCGDANKECPVLGYIICFCWGPPAVKKHVESKPSDD